MPMLMYSTVQRPITLEQTKPRNTVLRVELHPASATTTANTSSRIASTAVDDQAMPVTVSDSVTPRQTAQLG